MKITVKRDFQKENHCDDNIGIIKKIQNGCFISLCISSFEIVNQFNF